MGNIRHLTFKTANVEYDMKLPKTSLLKFKLIKYSCSLQKMHFAVIAILRLLCFERNFTFKNLRNLSN